MVRGYIGAGKNNFSSGFGFLLATRIFGFKFG